MKALFLLLMGINGLPLIPLSLFFLPEGRAALKSDPSMAATLGFVVFFLTINLYSAVVAYFNVGA